MATTKKPPQRLCCVSIDYHSLLLPADKGRKLVELLEDAVRVRQHHDGRTAVFLIEEPVQVEYHSVKPDQVRAKPTGTAGAQQLQLEDNPGFGALR